MRILIIEDDQLIGDGIKQALIQDCHAVDWMTDGASGLAALENEPFDICILDLGLPKKNGLEVLRKSRQEKINVRIIILTAQDSPQDKVAGLDYGADDYLTKPFDIAELLARIRAIQRRSSGRAANLIIHRNIELDPGSHTVKLDGEIVLLPRKEFALLQKLLENIGNIITKDALELALYSWDNEVDSNALEVHIHHLRKKLGTSLIRTVRGVGYIIDK
ncbi:MAG: response regulator [Gammaproteobacteria bacterium]|nr:response regulator [Gammaproteobacteria bacterium]